MAFPTTPTIDSFGRADSLLDSSLACSDGVHSWFQGGISSGASTECSIVSSQVTTTIDLNTGSAFVADTDFGPDAEVYMSWPVVASAVVLLGCRIANENTPGVSMYAVAYFPGVGWRLRTYGPFVTLASDNVTPFVDGEKIGISAIGSEITAWHYTGGAWVSRLSVTDTTFSNAGKIGFSFQGVAPRAFDFGGGTYSSTPPVVAGDAPTPVPPMFHGRGAC